jgi:B-cell receptor-associated protein 31
MKVRAETEELHSHGHTHDSRTDTYLHAKMFYAQRNVYLTGSCIFLALILNRFHSMVLELLKNEEKAEVLKQQAAKNSKEYMKLLDGDEGRQSEIDRLKKELSETKANLKEVEMIRKQAERTTKGKFNLTQMGVSLND